MADLPPPAPPALPPTQSGPRRFATMRTVLALILREMSTRYGRTPGGYAWAILEPLGGILVLSLGFSLVMRAPALGTSFILFFATGFMPFNLYQSVSGSVAKAINFSKPLLQYPAVTWFDASLARFLVNSLTGIFITIILLTGILTVIDSPVVLELPSAVEAIILAIMLGAGVGMLNCAVMGLFPIWEMIWSIITRPLFIASGVFFLYETMPPFAQKILWYNPLIHIVGLMRTGFYPTYTASYVSPVYVLGVSLALLAMGLILMGRYHRDILNR